MSSTPLDTAVPGEILRRWVRSLAGARNITPSRLAALSGVPQSSISRLLAGKADELSASSIQKLARISELPIPPQLRPAAAITERFDRQVEVWGVHPVRPDGEFRLNSVEPLQVFARPPSIQASSKLIAFYAPDDMMAPRWRAGEPVFVDLGRPGTNGAPALIKLAAPPSRPDDTETYLLCHPVRRSDGFLHIETYSSPDIMRIDLQRLLETRHVLSWREFFASRD